MAVSVAARYALDFLFVSPEGELVDHVAAIAPLILTERRDRLDSPRDLVWPGVAMRALPRPRAR
jgi:hypothetical protein